MDVKTIKPGLLVALTSKAEGNRKYTSKEVDQQQQGASELRKWEGECFTRDVAEQEAAEKCRSEARGMIAKLCFKTDFGLICPEDREQELAEAIARAHAHVSAFNATAMYTRVYVDALPARIAKDDTAAAKAITKDVRELLDAMKAAIAAADPKAIRDTCNSARQIGQMLSADLEEKVSKAVANARSIARKIVARVEKAGESAAAVLADINTHDLDQARFCFGDLAPEPAGQPAESLPAADLQRFADLDGAGLEGLLFSPPAEDTAPALDMDPDPSTADTQLEVA